MASSSASQEASITLAPDPDGDPGGEAVAGLDQHPGDRVGAVALVEDAHLVVDQLELRDLGVRPGDRLAQRLVQGVDRAVALTGDDQPVAAGAQLHRRLGDRLVSPGRESVMTRHDSTSKYVGRTPSASSTSISSKEASAASKV